MGDSKVKVAVRVRPLNRREIDLHTHCVVDMEDNQAVLYPPCARTTGQDGDSNFHQSLKKHPKTFAFDYCFWSIHETQKEKYSGQQQVFECMGKDILENAFQGYNACIFAYGQTGSGKSYTMMGSNEQPGLIPRLCSELFTRVAKEQCEELMVKVEVSYMEIYNERVRDLLDPKSGRTLRVREHKILGPYVDELSQLAVASYQDIESLMLEGNKSRTIAATNMNEESSRSHAVFTIVLTQTLFDLQSGTSGEKASRLSLVDLAGSERVSKTGAAGERLREGSNINKSLSTLGLVISTLAEQAAGKNKGTFVPYRDSALTWLLKDNLGGNSKTAMIATVSPAADSYEETLSTLRYADRAKRIVNHAVINEEPSAKIIRELREEVDRLRNQLTQAESLTAPGLKEKLEESEKLMQEMTVSWEEKLRKTVAIAQERQRQLESLGISLESSGIKVGDDKCFLVNLNADPALNELLVYYLQDRTRIGANSSQDIQLCGIGILPEHCTIDINTDEEVLLSPSPAARTCVNGKKITTPTALWHGDRILWGNNHYFRANLPRRKRKEHAMPSVSLDEMGQVCSALENESYSDSEYGYEYAKMEVMTHAQDSSKVPVDVNPLVASLEMHYKQEKHLALEQQRNVYEQELHMLRQKVPSGQSYMHPSSRISLQSTQHRLRLWSNERDGNFRLGLIHLRKQIVRANELVREANMLAEEMGVDTDYQLTLQIAADSLSANSKRGTMVSEPAVQVWRKGFNSQLWSLDKLENRLVDMRDRYQECRQGNAQGLQDEDDPFFEVQANHTLIGVANVFLECLFYDDVKLQYGVPILSQHGEVCGRLHVELTRLSGPVLEASYDDDYDNDDDDSSFGSLESDDENERSPKRHLQFQVRIREAVGLPADLSHFVFCQYQSWNKPTPIVVPPIIDADTPSKADVPGIRLQGSVKFDYSEDFSFPVTEELVELLADGALAIEVWGHRQGWAGRIAQWDYSARQEKSSSLQDRWAEVTRRLALWVQVQEMNENGVYMPVDVQPSREVGTGGIFQLKQGQSRRLQASVHPLAPGTLPIMLDGIVSISVGAITMQHKGKGRSHQDHMQLSFGRDVDRMSPDSSELHVYNDDEMDSYQEEDLLHLRRCWSEALERRRSYLDKQIQGLVEKAERGTEDGEREERFVDQWMSLTEERNAVLVPASGSGVPGAPADWSPPVGMETHIPVVFLNLKIEELGAAELLDEQVAGQDCFLPGERGSQFYFLPIIRQAQDQVLAVASWDPSIHDSPLLNRVTPSGYHVFCLVKLTLQLSYPACLQLVLRKRVCLSIYSKQSLTQVIRRRISMRGPVVQDSGVMYEIVSNIPKASAEAEDVESLALLAARGDEVEVEDGDSETSMQRYTRRILAVSSLLEADRLRQRVAVREGLVNKGKLVRKSCSSPNVLHLSSSRLDLSSGYEEQEPKGFGSNLDLPQMCRLSFHELSPLASSPKQPLASRQDALPKRSPSDRDLSLSTRTSSVLPKPMKSLAPLRQHLLEQGKPFTTSQDSCDIRSASPEPPGRILARPTIRDNHIVPEPCRAQSTSWETSPGPPVLPSQGVFDAREHEVLTNEMGKPNVEDINGRQSDTDNDTISGDDNGWKSSFATQLSDTRVEQVAHPTRLCDKEIQDHADLGHGVIPMDPHLKLLANAEVPTPSQSETCKESLIAEVDVASHQDDVKSSHEENVIDSKQDTETQSEHQPRVAASLATASDPPETEVKVSTRRDSRGELLPNWLTVGTKVMVDRSEGKTGVVAFVGTTAFSSGIWVGVELDLPAGKNNGSVQGKRYFHCSSGHGVFLRPDRLSPCRQRPPGTTFSQHRSSQSQDLN
uniref:kinesin-like protein KIF13A n=1 Tax=Myxine glutinosa TaxID=7769 RepID=UPI0035901023